MKLRHSLSITAAGLFAVTQFANGQCPQICDSNENTALGDSALANSPNGSLNTAVGFQALRGNSSGIANTAFGHQALINNNIGVNNTAIGFSALLGNTTGNENTAVGKEALGTNTGSNNTAVGSQVMQFNSTGSSNTAVGLQALLFNTTGDGNTVLGLNAMLNNTTGTHNVAIGESAGISLTTGSGNIDIASGGVAGESRTIRIGTRQIQRNTYIAGISGVTVANGVGVIIDNQGHLGTVTSSARYKDDIHPMDKASEAILNLKPVAFRYKKELDPQAIPQFGLVAEDVAKVDPRLVATDDEGKPYTVRYEAVNAMLLNEFLKEHRKVEKLEAAVSELSARLDKLSR